MIDPAKRWKFLSIGLMGFLALVALPATVVPQTEAASESTNLVQQILNIVKDIQTKVNGLSGASGPLSTLQSDVSTIKTKTDELPTDTNATLTNIQQTINDIDANTGGAGPLNRMFMHRFDFGTSDSDSRTCASTGPYLLFVNAEGADASLIISPIGFTQGLHTQPSTVVVGAAGNTNTVVQVNVGSQVNPNAYAEILITMQTTEGAVVSCN